MTTWDLKFQIKIMYSSILFLLRMLVVIDIFQDEEDKEHVINLEAMSYTDEVLKTDRKKCVVCGVGDVVRVPTKNFDVLVPEVSARRV